MTASHVLDADAGLAARLFAALQERGGIYSAFASFLRSRADLLNADAVMVFRHARERLPASRLETTLLLREDFGALGDVLANTLHPEPCWSTLARYAFRAEYLNRPVVVQVARAAVSEKEFHKFEKGVRGLSDAVAAGLTAPRILSQFQEWLRLTDDPERERQYLEALRDVPVQTSFHYPQLIPELCSALVLCWTWVEGAPIREPIASQDEGVGGQLAELILDQCCILGMVDGDLDPDNIAIATDGRLAVRRWNRLISLPPVLMPSALKYLSAVMANDSTAAARNLLRLCFGDCPANLESALLKELSAAEPELKGRLRFPEPAAIFESNWRALPKVCPEPPLYLDCLHRNLNALGYWCAESSAARTSGDSITEAQFSVLGRLTRRRIGDLATADVTTEWALGSAVLFAETLRQMSRTAEEIRTNEVFMGLDLPPHRDSRTRNRDIQSVVSAGTLLLLFLISLHFARSASAPWSVVLPPIAAAAGARLIWVVARIG